MNKKQKNIILLVFVLFIAITLRLIRIGRYDFWYDEAINIFNSQCFFDFDFIRKLISNGMFPPFVYSIFLGAWKTFGNSEFILRISSVIINLFSLTCVFFFTRKFFDNKTAIFSIFMLMLSPLQIYYAQELSVYSLYGLLSAVSYYLYFLSLKNKESIIIPAVFLTNICVFYVHPMSMLLVFTQTCALIFIKKYNSLLKQWCFFLLVYLFLTLPFFRYVFLDKNFFIINSVWSPKPGLENALCTFYDLIFGYNASAVTYIVGVLLLVFLLIRGALKSLIQFKEKGYLLCYTIILPLISLFVFSRIIFGLSGKSVYVHRYLIFIAPFLSIILAKGLEFKSRKTTVILSVIFVIFITSNLFNYYNNRFPLPENPYRTGVHARKDFKSLIEFLKSRIPKDTPIVHNARITSAPFLYYQNNYFNKILYLNTSSTPITVPGKCPFFIFNSKKSSLLDNFSFIERQTLFSNCERFWLIFSDWDQPRNGLFSEFPFDNKLDWRGMILEKYSLVYHRKFTGIDLYYFVFKNKH
ncbi:glycosyltransferase family 39 protein [Patescibacteria group bacterium]|nr:glycosyltransferase family 39 protein [Patescibacteria group bacterium]